MFFLAGAKNWMKHVTNVAKTYLKGVKWMSIEETSSAEWTCPNKKRVKAKIKVHAQSEKHYWGTLANLCTVVAFPDGCTFFFFNTLHVPLQLRRISTYGVFRLLGDLETDKSHSRPLARFATPYLLYQNVWNHKPNYTFVFRAWHVRYFVSVMNRWLI